jgi:uncharacterized Ntn-hydrolase superfamily protein
MLRRTLPTLLGLLLLAPHADATWSIVCVNRKTREVGVATATCLTNFSIRTGVPVIVVGEGAAAAQSFLDQFGQNRRLIFESFRDTEETPAEILAALAARDNRHQTRQYGIVNFAGLPVTFTGNGAGRAASGLTGIDGDVAYAIQGNVLVGNEVVLAAEQAFLGTKGDMGQRLMAAMEAARALGGDGRCSCNVMNPTACGVPPPSFTKSAHAGAVLVARVGDPDGACDEVLGCAQGAYYLVLNVRGRAIDPDPVFTLQGVYKTWRERLEGRPDGVLSRMSPVKALPIDGVTERRVVLELYDLDERRITRGGAVLEIETRDGRPAITTVGPVEDRGDGSYVFTLRAGTRAGLDRFRVRVIDVNPLDASDIVTATLYPELDVRSVDAALYAGSETLSARTGGTLGFVVSRPERAFAPYVLSARLSGGRTRPGALGRGPLLPLGVRPFLPAGPLVLDERGRSESVLDVPPGVLEPLIGRGLAITGHVLGPTTEPTNTVVVAIEP